MAERKINTRTFKTEPLLATEAIRMQVRLVKAIGPGLSRLPAIFAGIGKVDVTAKEKADVEAIAALGEIIAALEPDEAASLVKDIVEMAQVKRPSGVYEQVDIDGDFTGSLGEIIPVAAFVLQEQFGDVFSGALANGRRVQTAGAR